MSLADFAMTIEGVMVSYTASIGKNEKCLHQIVTSGMKFSERWILTHGFLLAPLEIGKLISETEENEFPKDYYANLPDMFVTCEAEICEPIEKCNSFFPLDFEIKSPNYKVNIVKGKIRYVWRCPKLANCMDKLLRSWIIGHTNGSLSEQTNLRKDLCSVFVLIDLRQNDTDFEPMDSLTQLYELIHPTPSRGDLLEIHSTPLGCEVFLNSVTKGAVCSVIDNGSLLLTDAVTALGSEGGPVFGQNSLVGMVVSSVSWCRGEWVGLTLVAPLANALATKLNISPSVSSLHSAPSNKPSHFCDEVDGTMLVRCGDVWGSGIYLGDRYILTCAHVVMQHHSNPVSVYCHGMKQKVEVVYKTEDGRAYDLAVLRANSNPWKVKAAALARKAAEIGEPVIVAGFPYFNEMDVKDLKPTITSGYVTNACSTMIQTSCCVQSGFSGGPVYHLRKGKPEVIGIIVSSAKTETVAYPYINMAVPVTALKEVINNLLSSEDLTKLQQLDIKKDIVQSQWKLKPYRCKI